MVSVGDWIYAYEDGDIVPLPNFSWPDHNSDDWLDESMKSLGFHAFKAFGLGDEDAEMYVAVRHREYESSVDHDYEYISEVDLGGGIWFVLIKTAPDLLKFLNLVSPFFLAWTVSFAVSEGEIFDRLSELPETSIRRQQRKREQMS